MNVVRKTISFAGIILMLAFFSSCAKKTAASNEPVVIDFWYAAMVTEAGPPPSDWPVFKIVKDKFNIDLRLTALPSNPNDQDVKIQSAGAANSLPDIVTIINRDVWLNMVNQGLLASVDEMYAMMPVRTARYHDKDSIAFSTLKGKSCGMAYLSSALPRNEGVLIRKDWLDKLNLPVPVTTEDFVTVMRAFTFNDPDGNGRKDTWGYGAFLETYNYEEGLGRRMDPLMGAFGVPGTWNMNEKNAGLNIHKPEYYDAMEYVKRIVDEGLIDPNWLNYKKDDFRAAWKQGRFGIMREQMAAYSSESNYTPFDKNFPDGEWIVIDPPTGPQGKKAVGVYIAPYRLLGISEKAAKAGKLPAIAKLLEWMSSNEGYYLIGWGEKGVNYNLDSNGIPAVDGLADPSKGYTKPEMQPLLQLRDVVFYNSDVELAARYPVYKAPYSGKTMNTLAVLRDMQSRAWVNVNGSNILPAPSVDLKRFYEQGILEFLTGKRKLTRENWSAWVAEYDKLGGAEWEKKALDYAAQNGLLQK